MKALHILIALMLIAAVSTSHAQVGLLDSDTEVQAPIRKGEKPVIPFLDLDQFPHHANDAGFLPLPGLLGRWRLTHRVTRNQRHTY